MELPFPTWESLDDRQLWAEIEDFLSVYDARPFGENQGGMGASDMFSLFYVLRHLRPSLMLESGSWHGWSLWLARNALGTEAQLVSVDPMAPKGYIDESTKYFTGKSFTDFTEFTREMVQGGPSDLCFFDDHQDVLPRLIKAKELGFHFALLNDNYPSGTGGHRTLAHLIDRGELPPDLLRSSYTFPNITPGDAPKPSNRYIAIERKFDVSDPRLRIFNRDAHLYRWNTFVAFRNS